jgi:hypothetical protein
MFHDRTIKYYLKKILKYKKIKFQQNYIKIQFFFYFESVMAKRYSPYELKKVLKKN